MVIKLAIRMTYYSGYIRPANQTYFAALLNVQASG